MKIATKTTEPKLENESSFLLPPRREIFYKEFRRKAESRFQPQRVILA